MKILGIGWVGTPTERVDEMAQFCENVLGLQRRAPMPGIESFDFPNGDIIEIVGPTIDMGELEGWNCPKTDCKEVMILVHTYKTKQMYQCKKCKEIIYKKR